MITRLDHVVIAVRDLDAATGTYRALLGRNPSRRDEDRAAGTASARFHLENTDVELVAARGSGAAADRLRAWLSQPGEGPYALVFGTDDLVACGRTLRDRGIAAATAAWGLVLPPAATRGVELRVVTTGDPLPPAAPVGAPEAAVVACDHVVVTTTDPEAARMLYGDGLGLRLALDRTFEAWGARLLFFRTGHLTVEVAARLGAAPEPVDRFWGISWRVPDVEATRARLADAGFDVSEIRTGRRPGTRVMTVRAETHGVATLLLGPD